MRRYSYTILLAVSILLAAVMWKTGYIEAKNGQVQLAIPEISGQMAEEEPEKEAAEPILPLTDPMPEQPEEALPTETEEELPAPEPDSISQPVMYEADLSWFDDALFIGDSRTEGLSEYGDLGNAEVMADVGMSVYKIFQKEFTLKSGEKKKLEELLAERQFGKIYVMLGINEMGYSFDVTVTRYREMIERMQELQPDALIFLEANLHISKAKSASSATYNNESIDRFNQAVAELEDGKRRFYLDVNELFDDGEGNLADEYTADDAHVLAKYYPGWSAWLLRHAVTFE